MAKQFYFLLFALLLYAASPVCAAPEPVKQPLVLKLDSSQAGVKSFDSAALRTYHGQPEFTYRENVPKVSGWDRFWAWFWSLFRVKSSTRTGQGFYAFFKYILIALGIAAIVVIVIKVMGMDLTTLFKRKSASVPMPYTEGFENIHEINFDTELEQAVASHNYRLAVRLLYLKCLKQLNDAGRIQWEQYKTNSAYISELNDAGNRQAFSQLTRQFEYVWYGEFGIDAQVYQYINNLFINFRRNLA